MKTTEIDIQITPRKVWFAIVATCLLVPLVAKTADKLVAGGRLSSPGAVFRTLVVTGDARSDAGSARGIVLAPGGQATVIGTATNASGKVRMGPTPTSGSSNYRLYVAGNLWVTGCIYLNGNPRCDWAE